MTGTRCRLSYGKEPWRSTSSKLRTNFWFRWGDLRITIIPHTVFKGIGIWIGSGWIRLAMIVRSNSIQHR